MKHKTWSPILGLFVIGAIVGFWFATRKDAPSADGGKACTQEAKKCPDGTYVGRSGPNCEFTPCGTNTARSIRLFYYNAALDKDASGNLLCSSKGVAGVVRNLPVTQTPIQDAVKMLILGQLTAAERAQGITTGFPIEGFSLTAASVNGRILTLTFSDPQHKSGGGACAVSVLRAQVDTTARQFEGIDEVRYKPDSIFQP